MSRSGIGRRRPIAALALALLGVVGLFALWPAQLGGRSTYVTTHGISMQPLFHSGDLAVVRPAEHYAVGDIAAYHSQQLKTVVLHRIVAVQQGRFVFQGDHNSWLDPEPVSTDQIIGSLRLRIPHAGSWLNSAARPWLLTAGLGVLVLIGGSQQAHRRTRRRHRMSRHALTGRPRLFGGRIGDTAAVRGATTLATACAAAGVVLGALSSSALTQVQRLPTTEPAASISYDYSAAVAPSAAYPGRVATSPDPIFRKVAKLVTVHYRYRGPAAQLSSRTELSASSGWHQSVPGPQPGSVAPSGEIQLDLTALDRQATAAAAATGVPINQLTITVITTATAPDGTSFQAPLALHLSPDSLTLAQADTPLTVEDPTKRQGTSRRVLPGPLGDSLDPGRARLLALAMLATAALLATGSALAHRRTRGQIDVATIRRRYRSLLLAVEPVATSPTTAVLEVADIDALASLASRLGLMIVYWSRSGVHTFAVCDDRTIYRYRCGSPTPTREPQQQPSAVPA